MEADGANGDEGWTSSAAPSFGPILPILSSGTRFTGGAAVSDSIRAYEPIAYDGVHCRLTIQRLTGNVVVVRIAGTDIGEFGDGPFRALDQIVAELAERSLSLFIDARDVRGASLDVSGAWAKWLRAQSGYLRRVCMLAESRFIAVTADFVRRFARLEKKMTVLSREEEFDLALGRSLRSAPACAACS
jgi:hypothetical protein